MWCFILSVVALHSFIGPSTTATPSKYLVLSVICRRYEQEVCMFGCDQIVRANPCSSTRKCEDVYEWCLQRSQEHQASIKRLNVNTMRNNIKNVVELVANNSSDPTTTIAATTTDPRDAVSSIDCRRYEQEVCMFGCDRIVRANPCSSTRKCEDVYKWCLRRSQRHLASIKRFNVNTMRNNIKNVELMVNNSSDPTTTIAAATTDPRDAVSSTVCRRNEEEVCRIACDRIVRANPCSSTRKCEDVYKRCLRRCQEDFQASLKQLVVNTMRKNIKNVTGLAMNNSSDPTTTIAAATTDPRDAGPSTTATPANYLVSSVVCRRYEEEVCRIGCSRLVIPNPCPSSRRCEHVYKWCFGQEHLVNLKQSVVNTMRKNIKNFIELAMNNSSNPTTTTTTATTDRCYNRFGRPFFISDHRNQCY